MEIRLDIKPKNESPLSFLNSLKAFLKEKIGKNDIDSIEISMPTDTIYEVLFAETTDDQFAQPKEVEHA